MARRGWRAGSTANGPARGLVLATVCGGVVAVLGAVALGLSLPLVLTSWASSMALITTMPTAPAAQPWRVAGGHLSTGAVGLALLLLAGHVDAFRLAGAGIGPALQGAALLGLSVAGGVLAMMLARTLHPPAAANGPLILLSVHASPGQAMAALVIGAAGLALAALLVRASGHEGYPAGSRL
jgi:CBS-domain-containing membrane protein